MHARRRFPGVIVSLAGGDGPGWTARLAPRCQPVSRDLADRLIRRRGLIVVADPGHPVPPYCPCRRMVPKRAGSRGSPSAGLTTYACKQPEPSRQVPPTAQFPAEAPHTDATPASPPLFSDPTRATRPFWNEILDKSRH